MKTSANITKKTEYLFDFFFPKHLISRDVSKLGFLEKIKPNQFLQIQDYFQKNSNMNLNLNEVIILKINLII